MDLPDSLKETMLINRSQFETLLITEFKDLKIVRVTTDTYESGVYYLLKIFPGGPSSNQWITLSHTRYQNRERRYRTVEPCFNFLSENGINNCRVEWS